jgi:hypothetical protein
VAEKLLYGADVVSPLEQMGGEAVTQGMTGCRLHDPNLRSPSFAKAREFIARTLANDSDGSLVRLSSDPQLEEMKRLWPVPADQEDMDACFARIWWLAGQR